MSIRLAIHDSQSAFSNRWIAYCRDNQIDHCIVDGHSSGVIKQLRGCDGFLWHFFQDSPVDLMMARHVLEAAECMGLVVFPNHDTCWHFDDKIAQNYLLQAIGAPVASTEVFYSRDSALGWLRHASYPLVWKLRRGAGSQNVRMVRTFGEAAKLCGQAFGKGFSPAKGYFVDAKTKIRKIGGKKEFFKKLRRMPREFMRRVLIARQASREKGYVLFQEFLPGNAFDIRIPVVGNRAWGYRRYVRENDFRASGSGVMSYDHLEVPAECVRIAFEVARALDLQAVALDFAFDAEGRPCILEMSYTFGLAFVPNVRGYWDSHLDWHEEAVLPQDAIIQDLLTAIEENGGSQRNRRG